MMMEIIKTGAAPDIWEVRDELGFTLAEFKGYGSKAKAQYYARTGTRPKE